MPLHLRLAALSCQDTGELKVRATQMLKRCGPTSGTSSEQAGVSGGMEWMEDGWADLGEEESQVVPSKVTCQPGLGGWKDDNFLHEVK